MFPLRSEYSMSQSIVDEEFAQVMESNPSEFDLRMDRRKAKGA